MTTSKQIGLTQHVIRVALRMVVIATLKTFPVAPRYIYQSTSLAPNFPLEIYTSPKAMVRSLSVALSRWPV